VFFQAEDGIRDFHVTGVQTCALPISLKYKEFMLLIFLDTETTGLDPDKHRTLEIAYKVIDAQTDLPIVSYQTIVSQPLEIWAEEIGRASCRERVQVSADEVSQECNHG